MKRYLGEPLTVREYQVLERLVRGDTNVEIGEALYIALPTVKVHLGKIFQKLGTTSRSKATWKALSLGLVRLPSEEAKGSMTVSEALEQLYTAYSDGEHSDTEVVFVDKFNIVHRLSGIETHPDGESVIIQEAI